MSDINKQALEAHKKIRGKIEIQSKASVNSLDDLSLFYSPGVGAVSKHIANNPNEARNYTSLNNTVAVISDGSAVLGLGNIGAQAALPVMEGKSILFKRFADIDSIPIVLDTQDADEIVATVLAIAPSFGGINLEDIAAPKCFDIEKRLKESLNMPLMHDDQHGTAIVVMAGLINALKLVDKNLNSTKIVIVGAGAAGTAAAKLLHQSGQPEIIMLDSKGVISKARSDINAHKRSLLPILSNTDARTLEEAIIDADVFIGVSKANLLSQNMIKDMSKDPIIFALANPDPEVLPEDAKQAGAAIIATGRSDFANQVNNAIAFPGIFRGALDNRVSEITEKHKLAAAQVIADLVDNPSTDKIIPDVFDERLVPAIAKVIT